MKKYIPTEEEEQQALFEWAALNYGKYPELKLMYHIPNEGKRSVVAGAKLKKIGLTPGVPDICLPVPTAEYGALYIELKRLKNYSVSDEQRTTVEELNKQGNLAAVCFGFDVAKDLILQYLKLPRKHTAASACLYCAKHKECIASAHYHSFEDKCFESANLNKSR